MSVKTDWGSWFIDYYGYTNKYQLKQSSDYQKTTSTKIVPETFSIVNYPNPFNPATNFDYKIVKPSYVTLEIFDVLGRKIKTLVNEFQDAGNHSCIFHADNLTSGTYIYIIRSGNISKSGKILLLK